MKKHQWTRRLLPGVLLAALLVQPAFPCHIRFDPGTVAVTRNTPTTVKVQVELEHRRCPVPLEDTELDTRGVEVIRQGEWIQLSRNLYEIELTLLLQGDSGELRVVRECEKKGLSEGTLKVVAQ